MNADRKALSVKALHLVPGIVVLIESVIVAFSYKQIVLESHIGLPSWTILTLAVIEIGGAILFLIPPTIKLGSYILLLTFLAAILIHILHGQYNVGSLLVYAAVVIAIMFHLEGAKNERRRTD